MTEPESFNPTSPAAVARLLREQGIHPSRRLGQSFLTDRGTAERIVASSGLRSDETCLEIGPGLGALTRALAPRAAKVVAVEVDGRLAEALTGQFPQGGNVQVIHADFLKLDLPALLEAGPVRVVANIPYSITTPIIEKLILHKASVSGITLLVQKEVAERITAAPGSAGYSSLTVFCAYHTDARLAFNVSRRLFLPAPEVDSAVLVMTPKPSPLPPADEAWFFRILRSAFGQRRKTLVNSVSDGVGIAKADVSAAIERAGIQPAARPEDLALVQFLALAAQLQQ